MVGLGRKIFGFRPTNDFSGVLEAVLIEIGNSFSGRAYRSYAVDFFDKVGSEPNFEIVSLSDALIDAGVDLFRSRMDKNWSLVDCISFVVMKDLKVELALTNDHHFVQAGFRALLRED